MNALMHVVDTIVTVINVVLGWQMGMAWHRRESRRIGWLLVIIVCFGAFFFGLRIGYLVWTDHHHGAL